MTNMQSGTQVPPSSCQDEVSRVRQLIMGFRITQLMYVAARLSLADHLSSKPQTAQELAAIVCAEPRALYRLMRALASVGVFSESNDGLFEMTPAAELLRRENPSSVRSTAMLYGDELLWQAYSRLSHAIETGKPAFDQVYGQPFYDYLSQHPVPAALFHEAMTGFRNRRRPRSLQLTTSPSFDASLMSAADKVR